MRRQALVEDRPAEKGFLRIFNGKDLTGWDGNPKLWSVKDGAITGQTTAENPAKDNTFLIWTNGTVADFELRCSFKLTPGDDKGFANSGIQYRSKVLDPANWVVGGYQADMEAGPTYTGILYEERMTRGIMAARGEKVIWDNGRQEAGRRLARRRRRDPGAAIKTRRLERLRHHRQRQPPPAFHQRQADRGCDR